METSLEAGRASVSSGCSDPAGGRKRKPKGPLWTGGVQPQGWPTMFIKVMFGAGRWELVNTWCSPVTLTAHLRQRAQVPPDAIIALLAEDGHLVSLDEGLEEGASPAPSMGRPLLQERGTYVLVQIFKGEGGAPTRYESLLENLDDQYPELAEELRHLSGLHPTSDGRKRHTSTWRGHQEQGPLSRLRRMGSLPSRTR